MLKSFFSNLQNNLLGHFFSSASPDKEVASWYLYFAGTILGQRGMEAFVQDSNRYFSGTDGNNDDVSHIHAQKISYVQNITTMLATITEECVSSSHDEEDTLLSTLYGGVPRSPVLQSDSSFGYIPTVPMTDDFPAFSFENEQLGRLLSGLASFLSNHENRSTFCTVKTSSGPPTSVLTTLLDKKVGIPVQIYYQAVLCLWILSFAGQRRNTRYDSDIAHAFEEARVPWRLTVALKSVRYEKVVRICLATLRNSLSISSKLRKEMIGAGLVVALQSPLFQQFDDDDIRKDLNMLADALENELARMSSFEVYKAEVLSGGLGWTPAHLDETFWLENVGKLERNQQEVLRCLIHLLHESNDETVLAVACHDLAQFMRFHPHGRAIAQSLGVKTRLMQLMVSGDGDVRRYALGCMQVLMVRWNRRQI